MKVLFLSRWFPVPYNNGSKLRVYNLLRGLAERHDITLLSFTDRENQDLDSPEVRLLSSDVKVVPWQEFRPYSGRSLTGLLSVNPRSLLDTHSVQMESLIRHAISKTRYDVVIASQLSMASYYPAFCNLPAMFEEIELGVFHDNAFSTGNPFGRVRLRLTWIKLKAYFSRLLRAFRSYTVVSSEELSLFSRTFPMHQEKVKLIPNCVDFDRYQGLDIKPDPHQLIFIGSFRYRPNYEAMVWFLREVYPRVLAELPEIHLSITGDHAGLALPDAPNVMLTGQIHDIRPLVASSWISLAPLLHGGGTRLKILEAMAVGTPVVSTSKGAQGLNASAGEHLLIADSPDAFASQIIRICRDISLRDQLSASGKRFVEARYDWKTVMPRFVDLVERAAH